MNPLTQHIGKTTFQNLGSLSLRNEPKGYNWSFWICVFSFLTVSFFDILISFNASYFPAVILVSGLILLSTLCSFFTFGKHNNHYVSLFYLLILCFISYQVFKYGFLTGCYFYLLPASVIHLLNKKDCREKRKPDSIFYNFMIFIAWAILIFLLTINLQGTIPYNSSIITRLIASVFLSVLFYRHFTIVLSFKKKEIIGNINAAVTPYKNDYSEILFQSDRECFIVIDKETKEIVDYNRYTATLFELPEGMSLNGLYFPQLMIRHLSGCSVNIDTLMNNIPDFWQGEAILKTHYKREFNVIINNSTFSNNEKEYQILNIRDISEFKKIEKELNFSKEKLDKSTEVKTRFLSSMSHELRTPLNGIIGTTNLLLAEPNLSEKVKTQLGLQVYSSEHMLSIINDILDFSKIESGKMELNKQSFNLLEALHFLIHSVQSQFRKNNIELIHDFDPQLHDVLVMSDVVKLRQVLFNLISNALKFTIDGNVTVTSKVENADGESITVSFKVKDTGIGIKKEKQSEIFEDFAQVHSENLIRRFGGTGLGLTISEKLVNLFGSKIHVESEIGKGSCFYFTLTFTKSVQETKVPEEAVTEELYIVPSDIRGIRVLIVEDNEVNAGILIMFLQKWGVRIKEASNGIQALEIMKYHTFDLILMDLEMPEMNGYTTVKIIRESNNQVPIIAFTATLLENMDSLVIDNGFNDYILKPFSPSLLKNKIEKYVTYRKIEYA